MKSYRHTQEFKTTCSYCGVGCGMIVKQDRANNFVIEGDPDHPVNKGMLCSKGMNLHHAIRDTRDRLLYPEMRWSRHHPLERVSWDSAIQRCAAVFTSIIGKYGPDAVAFYVSGQCLTEEYYIANKLVKGFLGTNNIDTNSRLCMSSAVAAFTEMLGEDAPPVSYDDIELADTFLIAGANPAWCHPILFRRIEAHKKNNPDVRIIVVDPRNTQTTSVADLHLAILPGTDIYLFNAIARILIEGDHIDSTFISKHTEEFDRYRHSVFQSTVEEAARVCQVEEKSIRQAAAYVAESNGFLSLWAMGLNQSVIGVNKNAALIGLHLLTGKIGKPGSGPFSLTGQPNAMGGREVGGLATTLAAHRKIEDIEHRRDVAHYWGAPRIAEKKGATAMDIVAGLEAGSIKAVWIVCTNPLVSLPDSLRVEKALQAARFVVVQDISRRSDSLAFADVILPAAGHLEKDGTMTNSERRISYLSKVLDPPGEAKPDAEILCLFARAMGFKGFNYGSAAEIYDEHCQLTAGTNIDITGLTHARLRSEGTFQWPVLDSTHTGTPRLFTEGMFFTSSGKARFLPAPPANLSEPVTPDFPLILTTGRIRDQWHTMTKTGKVSKLRQHTSRPYLEIHPEDAAPRMIKDGDAVIVSNTRGTVRVCAKVVATIKQGVVFLPMHWGRILELDQARANNLTSSATDPVSRQPDFKFAAVQVARYEKPVERIIVAGAGAAAHRFLRTYRTLNTSDEITVIARENDNFYDRVRLPEYINGKHTWNKLQKFADGEMDALHFNYVPGNEVVSIDRSQKTITDKFGKQYGYDKLILATGSRANLPQDAPADISTVFTMRTRQDADRLRERLTPGSHILIVGGGLLGLELALALREIDVHVSILQLGSRLMERQIDHVAGELLLDFIDESGVTVYMNDQLTGARHDPAAGKLFVSLRSGRTLAPDALVYAVGTRPNIEFAQEAGIETARGIIVDDFLRTNDPNIFAIGEIAEHRGRMLGITAAAEKQADVLARFLYGDLQSTYNGGIPMNILKLSGFELCSIGIPVIPPDGQGYDEITFIDRSQRYYKKCIIKDDRLVGAILVGDKAEFAEFRNLIENKTELSEKRLRLLRAGKTPEPVRGELVCTCGQVGEITLRELAKNGHRDLASICEASGAGLGCGSCKPEIQLLIRDVVKSRVLEFAT